MYLPVDLLCALLFIYLFTLSRFLLIMYLVTFNLNRLCYLLLSRFISYLFIYFYMALKFIYNNFGYYVVYLFTSRCAQLIIYIPL